MNLVSSHGTMKIAVMKASRLRAPRGARRGSYVFFKLNYLFAIVQKLPEQVIPRHHNAPCAPNGGRAGARGLSSL